MSREDFDRLAVGDRVRWGRNEGPRFAGRIIDVRHGAVRIEWGDGAGQTWAYRAEADILRHEAR